MAVFREQQGDQLGMDRFVCPEIAPQETTDQTTIDRRIIAGEMDILQISATLPQISFQHGNLGRLAGPVQSFNNYQHNAFFIDRVYKYNYFCAVQDRKMESNRKISVMGIINLTDDSFYPESRIRPSDTAGAVRRAIKMVEEGADILDFGACSTRPGSVPVSPETEWERLAPVLDEVRKALPGVRISIDTFRSSVVKRAHALIGDFLVNDISAGEDDPSMLETVGRLSLSYIAMHKKGTPETMDSLAQYSDVTGEVLQYFRDFGTRAAQSGITDWILDPGFGFAKTVGQNYELLRNLSSFQELGRPLLVGISRKRMVWELLGITPEKALPATSALHLEALRGGASILRVHDVPEAVQVIRLYRELNP